MRQLSSKVGMSKDVFKGHSDLHFAKDSLEELRTLKEASDDFANSLEGGTGLLSLLSGELCKIA